MEPLTIGNVISLCSLAVAAFSVFAATWGRSRSGAANEQRMADKLDQIAKDCSDTRSELKELNRKLDDHAGRLVKCEEQISSLFHRLERLEAAHDTLHGLGGTD